MDFINVVMNRCAVRRFNEGGVEPDVIERIARLAQRAPSAGFSQGQRLLVVVDRERRREVGRICGEAEYEPGLRPVDLGKCRPAAELAALLEHVRCLRALERVTGLMERLWH